MNFLIHWVEVMYFKFLCFMFNEIITIDVGITFKLHNSIQIIPSTINVTNFAIFSFILIIVYGIIY